MRKLRLPKPQTVITPKTCQSAWHLTVFIILLIFTALLFSGCSPQKRLAHLLKQHPELVFNDTLNIITPVPIPEKNAEFIINYTYRDTLITLYSTDSIKLTYTKINDSIIKVFIHVPADTIYYPVTIPVEKIKIIKTDNWGPLIEKIPYIAISIVALFLAGLFFRKK